jgi:inorganic phosphate transporter, PiT family
MALGAELVIAAIVLALIFDFFNGVNDSANATATIIATRVLQPIQAVGLAAVFNFLGPFVMGTAVAKTVGAGLIDTDFATTELVIGALFGAITWTWLATHFGVPISVSHSLIGGILGAALYAGGADALVLPTSAEMQPVFDVIARGAIAGVVAGPALMALARGRAYATAAIVGAFGVSGLFLAAHILFLGLKVKGLFATVLFIAYSPLLGFLGGYVLNLAVLWLFRGAAPDRMRRGFGLLQLGSASFYALGHGTNDAQKTMGVIALVLFANGWITEFTIPFWVILVSAAAISLGTFIGGYKVVKTMGMRLTHLETHQGFSAETSSAVGLFFLAHFGVPVSTTHSIAGSIMGVGAVRGGRHVRWEVARTLFIAWILTIPAAAIMGYLAHWAAVAALGWVG